MSVRHRSMPPTHRWRPTHYRHISDDPAVHTHFLDGIGVVLAKLRNAFDNMGIAYQNTLSNNETNQTSIRQNAQEENHE